MDGFDIAAARKRKGIRQWMLAERVGLSTATLVDIEKNRVPLTPDLLTRLLTAIDASNDDAAEEKAAATA